MRQQVRAFIRDWMPPAVLRGLGHLREGSIRFSREYPSWAGAVACCSGYQADDIVEKVLAATLRVSRGEAAFERDSVVFAEIAYEWPLLAGLMWAAARQSGRLSVLDFGGSLGSSYFQHRKFLQGLQAVKWSIVEQAHYVEAGRVHIQEPGLRFYPTIGACLSENQPDVVLLSSVLQYLPEPYATLHGLADTGAEILMIDKQIVNASTEDRIHLQHVPPAIYSATYPCWSLSEQKLIATLQGRYRLVAELPTLEFPALRAINSEFKGYLFERTA